MSIEIEKKYVLPADRWAQIAVRLAEIGAEFIGTSHEENIIFQGGLLTETGAILRIRKVDQVTTLTFKRLLGDQSAVKRQIEYETGVENPEEMEQIVKSLGFERSLVYEKKRMTWRFGRVEIVLDELPFGRYMEIEGSHADIAEVESLLNADDLETEHATYPLLTLEFGTRRDGIAESRFH